MGWIILWLTVQVILFIRLSDYRGRGALFVWLIVMMSPTWYFFFAVLKIQVPCEENPRMYLNGYCQPKQIKQESK